MGRSFATGISSGIAMMSEVGGEQSFSEGLPTLSVRGLQGHELYESDTFSVARSQRDYVAEISALVGAKVPRLLRYRETRALVLSSRLIERVHQALDLAIWDPQPVDANSPC